jgi:predicted dehydrogenase
LGDIGAHIIDFAHYLVGNISEVNGMWETFRKERPLVEDPAQTGRVTVDDAALFLARFENGAIGTFEVTRFAGGNKDMYSFEVNGERGSLRYNYHQGSVLEYFSWDDPERIGGWRSIFAASPQHTYSSDWWPNGHIIHYGETFVSQMYELVRAIQEGRNPQPDFEVGARNQAVLEAVEESIVERKWVNVPKI